MISTSGFLTALEYTEFVFCRGSASDPTVEAYSAPPDPLAGLRGPTSKEEGEARERGKEEGKERGREGEEPTPLSKIRIGHAGGARAPPPIFRMTQWLG